MEDAHSCELPEPTHGMKAQCPGCGGEWEAMWEADYAHDGRPDVLGWYQIVTPQVAAEQVEALMHELAHEDIDPAVIHALTGCASDAITRIINIVYASHGPASAEVLRKGWNLFVRCLHPYFLPEPCQHHAYAEAKDAGQSGIQDG